MDMRGAPGGSRDGAVNRTLEGSERDNIVIENADEVSPSTPPTNSHKRGISESQNLLPNSPQNLFEYSSTKRYAFDQIDNTRYDPRSNPRINGRETPAWSGVPQNLGRSGRRRWLDAAVDILAILASMPFFALASALIWVDGEEVTGDRDNSLNQLIKGTATLFPFIFSVVVGRTMIKIVSWRVEHGASIGFLERLLGSRTVGGTIFTAIGLRSITIASLVLILLWLLSPLGSQSVLRMLSTTDGSSSSAGNVTYVNTRQQSYAGQIEFNGWLNALSSLLSASVLAPEAVKTSGMDTWDNVKIPLFSSLANISQDDNGWRQIPADFTPPYSSLLGVPVSNLGEGNSTFNVESTYTELTCSNRTSTVTRGAGTFINPGLISTVGPFIAAQNITSSTSWALGYLGTDTTYLLPNSSVQALDTMSSNNTAVNDILPGLLLYQDFTGTKNVTSIFCVPSQIYVESSITCNSTGDTKNPSCAVTAQRLSLLPHAPSAITSLSISTLFRDISSYLPFSTPNLNHIDIMQNYISSPLDNAFIQSTPSPSTTSQESRFLDINLEDFSIRFSQILNSILQGSTGNYTTYLTSSPSSSFPTTSNPILATSPDLLTSSLTTLQPTLTIPSTTLLPIKTYTISRTYLSLFLLSTTALLICSLVSLILTQITLLPSSSSYLTHLSSLLRDSPHLPIPSGGMTISGWRRTREVGDMRVRLGDVGGVGRGFEIGVGAAVVVGRVGLGLEGEKDGRGGVGKLGGRKLYL